LKSPLSFLAPRSRLWLVKKAVVAAMLSGDIPPNQTIYIKNLNDKVKKEGDFSSILLLAFNFLL